MSARLLSVHAGKPEPLQGKGDTVSAIRKVALDGPVRVGTLGIEGDHQVNRKYHGGPYKALCSYASEFYPEWNAQLTVPMPPGSFGENLFTAGLLEVEACLGDVYTIGDVRIQITGPRGPCSNLSKHWALKDLHMMAKDSRKTGIYFSVLKTGVIEAGLTIQLESRPAPGETMVYLWELYEGKQVTAEQLEAVIPNPALDPDLRRHYESRLKAISRTGTT